MTRGRMVLVGLLAVPLGCEAELDFRNTTPRPGRPDRAGVEHVEPSIVIWPSGDGSAPPDFRRQWEAMRARDQILFGNVSKIEIGMTEAEVVAVLGEGSRHPDGSLYYSISPASEWIDETTRVLGYRILFEDGIVRRFETDGAHYTFSRDE